MCLFFVFGEQKFTRSLTGYEGLCCQCHNCGNWNAHVSKTHPFITLCWIPLIPLSFKGDIDVHCNTCGWDQAIEQRPDVQAQRRQDGQPAPPPPPVPGQGPPPPVAEGPQGVPLQDQAPHMQNQAPPMQTKSAAGPGRYA